MKDLRNICLFSTSEAFRTNAATVTLGIAPETVKRPGTLHDTFYALDAVVSETPEASLHREQAAVLITENVSRFLPEDYCFGRDYANLAARQTRNETVRTKARQAAMALSAMEKPKDVAWVRPSFEIAITLARKLPSP